MILIHYPSSHSLHARPLQGLESLFALPSYLCWALYHAILTHLILNESDKSLLNPIGTLLTLNTAVLMLVWIVLKDLK